MESRNADSVSEPPTPQPTSGCSLPIPTHTDLLIQRQGFCHRFEVVELDVAEPLELAGISVHRQADAGNLAVAEELDDVLLANLVAQVPQENLQKLLDSE